MRRQHLSKETLISLAYREPQYRGKKLIIIGGKIIPTSWTRPSVKRLKTLMRKHPGEIPTIVYVPRAETLILLL